MKDQIAEGKQRFGRPKPVRFKPTQWRDMGFFAETNNDVPICHVARVFVDFGIRLCKLNGNQIPLIEQVRLQRLLVRRAKRDAVRSR